jgi:hypothetical protein
MRKISILKILGILIFIVLIALPLAICKIIDIVTTLIQRKG